MPAKLFNRAVPFSNGKIQVQFNVEAEQEPVEIRIYEEIGDDPWSGTGFTAEDMAKALDEVPRNRALDIRVNSAGGNVWDGMAIKTLLDQWRGKKTASIDGMAASVASWMILGCDEVRAPKHAQMFIHDAWGFAMGNAEDMVAVAKQLDKTSDQIADIYATKTGMSKAECRTMMRDNTLMTGEEAHEKGFVDRLTDDEPVANFSSTQLRNMKSKLAILNKISAPKQGGQSQTKDKLMNREQMVALLNKWGIEVPKDATDEWLLNKIAEGKPAPAPAKNAVTFKNGKDGDHSDECGCEDCKSAAKNKNVVIHMSREDFAAFQNQLAEHKNAVAAEKKKNVTARVKAAVEADKVPANQMDEWIEDALAAKDTDKFLNRLDDLPSRPPGIAPLNISLGDTTSVEDLNKAVDSLLKPQRYHSQNRIRPQDAERVIIANNAKEISRVLNRMKKFNGKGEMVGPLRDMWDAWAASQPASPRNANTMTADLLRQVILSELMRAFRREFARLDYFAHIHQSVPLEGNDYVKVPYYPLDTVASTEFKYSDGYVVTPNAQTLSKSILVGGKGDGTATAGSGRKYKGLQFSAYEIRRQPWLNIAQLTVMAAEQLAIDVRGDIIGAQISAANFGNAIWTGASGGFDHNVVTQYLLNAAIKAHWPKQMRHLTLAPDFYTTLLADPNISRFLDIGSTDPLRRGIVGELYGFDQGVDYDALLPVANYVRGGDGANTAGADPNSAGFISYPSAVLIATAPIMPPPGVLKKLVAYEQVVDDQTGLAFTYQYFGLELNNVDNEIIECTYGSGLGEVAALKRLTTQGN